MKKIVSIIALALCATILFTVYQVGAEERITPETVSDLAQSNLPVYQPGSIKLEEQYNHDFCKGFTRQYRLAYYMLWGDFWATLTDEEMNDYYEWSQRKLEETNGGADLNEMHLVSYIKRYNISREEFDSMVESFVKSCNELGFDMNSEMYEVPNADIIYTFDNDIINEYYRYA